MKVKNKPKMEATEPTVAFAELRMGAAESRVVSTEPRMEAAEPTVASSEPKMGELLSREWHLY